MSRKRTTAEELTPSSSMRAEVAVTCSSVVHGDDSMRTAGLRQMMVSIYWAGARFSKVPIINGPGRLSPFTLKIEVSIVLYLT